MKDNVSKAAGIYIHIPFCQAKCGYCDFYSVTNLQSKKPFINALIGELKIIIDKLNPQGLFDTIYFGGGTPSLLSVYELDEILNNLYSGLNISKNSEITLEANPGTLDPEKLKQFKSLGINRLSIGIQSFINEELRLLERIHSAKDAIKIVSDARIAGFNNLSLDLIFALPNQSMKNWKYNLKKALEINPEHISAYNLIFEEGTPFYQAREASKIVQKPENEELKFYAYTIDTLEENGFIHYEVSNFAHSEGLFSRHNQKYWNHTNYLGFGPSAHSFWNDERWSNVSSVGNYIYSIQNKKRPVAFKEQIPQDTREFETVFLSLRTVIGLNLLDFKKQYQFGFVEKYSNKVNNLIKNGYAEINGQYFRLTKKGLFISDTILSDFAHN